MREVLAVAQTSEIILPEDKPAWEWVRGRALQKVSPKYTHARLQAVLAGAFIAWARGQGRVGTEWRFRVTPPGEITRPLVPDVAYLSYARLAEDEVDAAEEPLLAPDVAVEILSPGDRRIDVDHKIGVYLAAGSALVIVIDPKRRVVEMHDQQKCHVAGFDDELTHAILPAFAITLDELLKRT